MVAITYNEDLEKKLGNDILKIGDSLLKDNLSPKDEESYFLSLFLILGIANEKQINISPYLKKIQGEQLERLFTKYEGLFGRVLLE